MLNNTEIRHREYSTPELAKILGVTTRKIISMLERGYLKASIQEASGHSSRRLFSFSDVFRAYITLELLSFGISVNFMRRISGLFEDVFLTEYKLLINKYGEPYFPGDNPQKTSEFIDNPVGNVPDKDGLPDTSPVLCMPLADMKATLVRRIEKLF